MLLVHVLIRPGARGRCHWGNLWIPNTLLKSEQFSVPSLLFSFNFASKPVSRRISMCLDHCFFDEGTLPLKSRATGDASATQKKRFLEHEMLQWKHATLQLLSNVPNTVHLVWQEVYSCLRASNAEVLEEAASVPAIGAASWEPIRERYTFTSCRWGVPLDSRDFFNRRNPFHRTPHPHLLHYKTPIRAMPCFGGVAAEETSRVETTYTSTRRYGTSKKTKHLESI